MNPDHWTPDPEFDPVEIYEKACAELANMTPGSPEYNRQLEVCQMLQVPKKKCEVCFKPFYERDLQFNSSDQLVCPDCQDSPVLDALNGILNCGQQIY